MRPSEKCDQDWRAVDRYSKALNDLLVIVETVQTGFGTWELRVPPSRKLEGDAALSKLARAAGPASAIADKYGVFLSAQRTGYSEPKTVSPLRNWQMCLDAPWLLPPDNVIGATLSLLGRIEHERDEARIRERTLAGRLARFIRFPVEVRLRDPAVAGSGEPRSAQA